jgi:hypothetical protein
MKTALSGIYAAAAVLTLLVTPVRERSTEGGAEVYVRCRQSSYVQNTGRNVVSGFRKPTLRARHW